MLMIVFPSQTAEYKMILFLSRLREGSDHKIEDYIEWYHMNVHVLGKFVGRRCRFMPRVYT